MATTTTSWADVVAPKSKRQERKEQAVPLAPRTQTNSSAEPPADLRITLAKNRAARAAAEATTTKSEAPRKKKKNPPKSFLPDYESPAAVVEKKSTSRLSKQMREELDLLTPPPVAAPPKSTLSKEMRVDLGLTDPKPPKPVAAEPEPPVVKAEEPEDDAIIKADPVFESMMTNAFGPADAHAAYAAMNAQIEQTRAELRLAVSDEPAIEPATPELPPADGEEEKDESPVGSALLNKKVASQQKRASVDMDTLGAPMTAPKDDDDEFVLVENEVKPMILEDTNCQEAAEGATSTTMRFDTIKRSLLGMRCAPLHHYSPHVMMGPACRMLQSLVSHLSAC